MGASLRTRWVKTFAQNEMRRRDAKEHTRINAKREQDQAMEAEAKMKEEMLFDKTYTSADQQEARVNNWRDYADDGRAHVDKKARVMKQFKQEEKKEDKPKFGQVELEGWKKDWK